MEKECKIDLDTEIEKLQTRINNRSEIISTLIKDGLEEIELRDRLIEKKKVFSGQRADNKVSK